MSRYQDWFEIEFTHHHDKFLAEVEVEQDGSFEIIYLKTDANIVEYLEDSYDFFMTKLAPLVSEKLAEQRMTQDEWQADQEREAI